MVYPYKPDTQEKFEYIWYNPLNLEHGLRLTADEKHKFAFLLKHYKNPYFVNGDVPPPFPITKNVREKRNVVRET